MTFRKLWNKIFWSIARPIQYSYWFIFRPHTRGAYCLIEDQNGEILLIRTTYGKGHLWTIPGGGARQNELLKETAAREAFEETGVLVQDIHKIGDFITTKQFKRDYVEIYDGIVIERTIKIDPFEIAEAKWFPINNLPAVRSPRVDQILSMRNDAKKSS